MMHAVPRELASAVVVRWQLDLDENVPAQSVVASTPSIAFFDAQHVLLPVKGDGRRYARDHGTNRRPTASERL